jgi:hypothetical protein
MKMNNKESLILEYLKDNPYFTFNGISTIRDGGTIAITTYTDIRFFIHKDNSTLHNQYPPTDENLITDKPTQVYILDRIENFKKRREHELKQINNVIQKLKQNENI